MDPMAAIKQTFFQECEEQLAELESGLLAMEAGDTDPETVNAVFRAVHSIKGGAGAFSLDDLVRFAHVFETALDHVRAGRLAATPDVLKIMLRAADVLADLVRAARDGAQSTRRRSTSLGRRTARPRSEWRRPTRRRRPHRLWISSPSLVSFDDLDEEPSKHRIEARLEAALHHQIPAQAKPLRQSQ